MKYLRLVLLLYAIICFIGAIALFSSPKGAWTFGLAVYLLINGTVIMAGAFYEGRYKAKNSTKTGFKPTGEKFIDHASGKTVEVHINPKTGERRYTNLK